jgi:hypothetical protein
MRSHDTARLDALPRKTLAMSLPGDDTGRKHLADDHWKHAIGRAIERALELAGLQKGQAAAAMGYGENQAPISRWIAGAESPQFARLWSVPELRGPLVIALAELSDAVSVETTITLRRRA